MNRVLLGLSALVLVTVAASAPTNTPATHIVSVASTDRGGSAREHNGAAARAHQDVGRDPWHQWAGTTGR